MKGKEVLELIATMKPIKEFVALIESYWDNYHQQSYICFMLYTLIEKAKFNMEVDIWNSKDEIENLAALEKENSKPKFAILTTEDKVKGLKNILIKE